MTEQKEMYTPVLDSKLLYYTAFARTDSAYVPHRLGSLPASSKSTYRVEEANSVDEHCERGSKEVVCAQITNRFRKKSANG